MNLKFKKQSTKRIVSTVLSCCLLACSGTSTYFAMENSAETTETTTVYTDPAVSTETTSYIIESTNLPWGETEPSESTEETTSITTEPADGTAEPATDSTNEPATEKTERPTDHPGTVTRISGDVNNDKSLNIKDVTVTQKAIAELLALSGIEKIVADVNNDGKVSIKDVTIIQKYIAGFTAGIPASVGKIMYIHYVE